MRSDPFSPTHPSQALRASSPHEGRASKRTSLPLPRGEVPTKEAERGGPDRAADSHNSDIGHCLGMTRSEALRHSSDRTVIASQSADWRGNPFPSRFPLGTKEAGYTECSLLKKAICSPVTVQVNGRVYDPPADVRKKPDGEYVYSIRLNENKKKTPAPPRQYQDSTAKAGNRPVRVPTDVSSDSITEIPQIARKSIR